MISIVTETYAPEINGVATTLGYVSRYLSSSDDVQIIRPRLAGQSPQAASTPSAETIAVASAPIPGYPELRFGFPAGRHLTRLWRERRPAAIYVATQGPLGWSAVRSARKLGIPVTSGFHTNFHQYSRFYGFGFLESLIRRYLRSFHHQTHRTLVPTRETEALVRDMGIENTAVWSRGIDCDLFSPQHRDESLRQVWQADTQSPVFLYVGRIAAEKNVALAVQAWRQAQRTRPAARLVMVGSGPLQSQLAAENPDIVMAGVKTGEALAAHYASADIFLFPSLTDTFGNVVLEAMASGLALVCFDQAAAHEHLEHEHSAALAAPGDQEAFCALARQLAGDTGKRQALARAARQKALGIDWNTMVSAFRDWLIQPETKEATHGLDSSN